MRYTAAPWRQAFISSVFKRRQQQSFVQHIQRQKRLLSNLQLQMATLKCAVYRQQKIAAKRLI